MSTGIFTYRHRHFLTVDIYFCAIILLAVSFLFSFSCAFPLLEAWDDDIFVSKLIPKLRFSFANAAYFFRHPVYNNYVPFAMLSYMLDYNLWGLNGLGYHIQSLFWHIIAAFGVYACFRFFKISPVAALLLSLLFALHPQRVESVVWISERRDVMCGAFYFWSFFFYMRSSSARSFPLLSFLLFICALLSKAMAVTLPAVLILYEMHREKSFFAFREFRKTVPFFLLSAVVILVTAFSCPSDFPEYNLKERLLISVFNYAWYFEKNIWPGSMSPLYPNVYISSQAVWGGLLFYILTFFALFCVFCVNRRYFTYRFLLVLLAYTISLSPIIGVFRVASGAFDYADRYSYIPAFFFLLGAACLIELFARQTAISFFYFARTRHFRNILIFLASVCIASLGVISYYYAKTWRDYKSLISCAAMYEPPNWMALSAFAIYNSKEGNLEAMELCADRILKLKGIVSAKDRIGARIMGNYLMGVFLRLQRKNGECIEYLEKAAADADMIAEPHKGVYARLFSMQAESYLRKGDKAKALDACNGGLKCLRGKKTADSYFLEGNKMMILCRYKDAVEAFSAAHKMAPESGMILESLKKAKCMSGQGR